MVYKTPRVRNSSSALEIYISIILITFTLYLVVYPFRYELCQISQN